MNAVALARDIARPVMSPPYLIFLGDAPDIGWAKTGAGLAYWRREECLGQFRAGTATVDLGLPDLDPAAAVAAGARTLVIGMANDGGYIDDAWVPGIVDALTAGLDVAAGLHQRLGDHPQIAAAAARAGRRLFDVRHPDRDFMPGTGEKRSGLRLLTVGVDCAVGKKFTALAIERELRARGVAADFCATGQTGIMIAGRGIAIDSVVADFISGAAEWLSPVAAVDHWHVIEGQGSLLHPAYAGVTLGLVHGSQPDALVICHEAGRTRLQGYERYSCASLRHALDVHLEAARLTNREARGIGVSLNTSSYAEPKARALLAEATEETGLPACDPVRFGVGPIVDAMLATWH
ncbi:MAG: hypothetical protein AMXMBFR37_22610 [Steroidobacteraceae bacterium]